MSSNTQPGSNKDVQPRIAGVIVTHGHLAGELLAAAEMIVGPISFISAVSIGWHDDVDAARDEVQRAITKVSQGAGVLLLTDMFGGTPTNIASMFLDDGNIEVVTGVNLPMVIKLASQTGQISLTETAQRVCDLGRQGIYRAGDLLAPPDKTETR
ncbi:MAG TPA: PTS sugar transporter subunit IIA [Pyrinomonadaceae bacterium]|nr:PTS sugar transporter subunit IIA [Pyrinomonadaceae bacterium]